MERRPPRRALAPRCSRNGADVRVRDGAPRVPNGTRPSVRDHVFRANPRGTAVAVFKSSRGVRRRRTAMRNRMIFIAGAALFLVTVPAMATEADVEQAAHDALVSQAPTAHTTATMPDVNDERDGVKSHSGDQGQSGAMDEHGQVGEQGSAPSASIDQVGGSGQQGGSGSSGNGSSNQDGSH